MSRRELGTVRAVGTTVRVYAVDELGALQLVLTGTNGSHAAVLSANAAVELAGLLNAWAGVDVWDGGPRDLDDDEPPGAWGPTREQEEGWDAREDWIASGHVAGQEPLPYAPSWPSLADRLEESARLLLYPMEEGNYSPRERAEAHALVMRAADRLR